MENLTGKSIGRYQILEPLGEGGMAVVYKAYDTRLECDVAIKFIRTDNLPPTTVTLALKRFEREAKSVARLTHSNIVKITDFGESDGRPYLVMEYLSGGTLKNYIRNAGRISWQKAAQILIPIADALEYAHENHLIHRDIKPANILLTDKGIPMLTDFGVAKIIDAEVTQDLTGTSAAIGTPEYMAPEQVTSKYVDKRADLYSLGVVFYEMIVGRRPFEADTPLAVLVKQSHDPLPNPSLFVNDLPQIVERFILKALAKDPSDRYQNAHEMMEALRNLEKITGANNEPVLAPLIIPSQKANMTKKRKLLIMLGFLGITLFSVTSFLLGRSLVFENGLISFEPKNPLEEEPTSILDNPDHPTAQPSMTVTPYFVPSVEMHCSMDDIENDAQPGYYDLTAGTVDYVNGILTVGLQLREMLPDPFPTNYSKEMDWSQLNQWALWIDIDGNDATGVKFRPSYDDRSDEAVGIEYEVSASNYKNPEILNDSLPLKDAFEGRLLKWEGNSGTLIKNPDISYSGNQITLNVPFSEITEKSKFFFTTSCMNTLCNSEWNSDTAYVVSCNVLKPAVSGPSLISPSNYAQVDVLPRKVFFEWTKIEGAVRYQLQLDCFNCCMGGKWCSEVNEKRIDSYITSDTHYTIQDYYGANEVRWRVAAILSDGTENFSDWSYFRFLK